MVIQIYYFSVFLAQYTKGDGEKKKRKKKSRQGDDFETFSIIVASGKMELGPVVFSIRSNKAKIDSTIFIGCLGKS